MTGHMHLAINGSDLGRLRGGNESYLWGLLHGLAEVTEHDRPRVSLILASSGAQRVRAEPAFDSFYVKDVGPYRRASFLLWQQTRALQSLRPDWLISTYFLPPVIPCRAAVLVHDLSFRAHPEYFPRSIAAYMRILTGLAIRRADRVVALSRFTQKELEHFYPHARAKSIVVYPGVAREFRPEDVGATDGAVLDSLGVSKPYVLVVGNIHPRKNLRRLLSAWTQLLSAGHSLPRLVWVGLERWDCGQLLDEARALGVQLLGFVPDECLPPLYRCAEALAYPSLYEGFGLPALEALACGTPVLTADATSLPEAVDGAAVRVPPTDVDALARGLAQVLFDEPRRVELRRRGLAHASHFRWEGTARTLLQELEAR